VVFIFHLEDGFKRFEVIFRAKEQALKYLEDNHLLSGTEEEYKQFKQFYSDVVKNLGVEVSEEKIKSIDSQLKAIGVYDYFSAFTFSCDLGVFKPNEKMYLDALQKCGCAPEEAVFIDDSVRNLEGAEKLGITPILIEAHPVADVETKYCKIHSLSELI